MKNNSVNKRYVPKLRFRGFVENWIQSDLQSLETNKYKIENSNLFLDAKAIMKKNYLLWNGEIHKNAPGDSIIFIKDGSNCGTYFYSKNSVKIASTCEYLKFLYSNDFFFHLLDKNKKNIRNSLITGNAIPHIYKKNLLSLHFKFSANELEREKISKFLNLLDKQISLLENKLKLTEQMKEYYKNFIFKLFFQHSKKQEFNKIFKKYKLFANDESLKQVTIGKTGLNIINKTNYKINNHKLIEINSLIIGIGIEEINFNLNLEKICCSSIYQTYRLNDEFNNIFICYFISKIISKNRNLITKKSTRREYEVIIKDLEKLKIPIPNSREQYKFGNLMLDLDLMIQKLNNKIKLIKKRKLFYLNNLFI